MLDTLGTNTLGRSLTTVGSRALLPRTKLILNAFDEQVSGGYEQIINTTVGLLNAPNVMSELDMLYVLCGNKPNTALVDWATPTRKASLVGSPTFTAFKGFAPSTDNYLNLNYTPSPTTKAQQNSILFGVRVNAALFDSSGIDIGADNSDGSDCYMLCRSSGALAGRVAATSSVTHGFPNASRRWNCLGRTSSGTSTGYVAFSTDDTFSTSGNATSTSSAIGTSPWFLGCVNSNGTPASYTSGRQYSFAWAGSGNLDRDALLVALKYFATSVNL